MSLTDISRNQRTLLKHPRCIRVPSSVYVLFFSSFCLPRTNSASGRLNVVQTTRHCGHSHRKLKRQTTSHPVWAFWKKHFLLGRGAASAVSLLTSHVKVAALKRERGASGQKKQQKKRTPTQSDSSLEGFLHSQLFHVNQKNERGEEEKKKPQQ